MKKRRVFSREFKWEAVRKVVELGLGYREVARELGIGDNLIHAWRKAFEKEGRLGKATLQTGEVEQELRRLREENRQLKIEREILKKAAAFFAKEST